MLLKPQIHKIEVTGDSMLTRGSSTLYLDPKQSRLKVSVFLKIYMLVFCWNMNFIIFVRIHWKRQNSSPLQYNSYETLSFTPVVETHSKCWSRAVPPRYLSSFWLLIHHRRSDYSHDLPHRRQASSTPICQLYSGGGRSLPSCICMSL